MGSMHYHSHDAQSMCWLWILPWKSNICDSFFLWGGWALHLPGRWIGVRRLGNRRFGASDVEVQTEALATPPATSMNRWPWLAEQPCRLPHKRQFEGRRDDVSNDGHQWSEFWGTGLQLPGSVFSFSSRLAARINPLWQLHKLLGSVFERQPLWSLPFSWQCFYVRKKKRKDSCWILNHYNTAHVFLRKLDQIGIIANVALVSRWHHHFLPGFCLVVVRYFNLIPYRHIFHWPVLDKSSCLCSRQRALRLLMTFKVGFFLCERQPYINYKFSWILPS